MLKVKTLVFPNKSAAKQSIAVTPIGNTLPLDGVHTMSGGYPLLSLAVVFHSTFAVGNHGSVKTVMLSEQLMFGTSLSASKEKALCY